MKKFSRKTLNEQKNRDTEKREREREREKERERERERGGGGGARLHAKKVGKEENTEYQEAT